MANAFRTGADGPTGPSPNPGGGASASPRSGDRIEVWQLSVAAWSGRLEACRALLSADEAARIDRLMFPRDRAVRTVARASLRCILARDLGRPPNRIELTQMAHGKPVLTGDAGDLQFSTSHSGDVILHAVTRGRNVGVDVEAIGGEPSDATLVRTTFSTPEAEYLERLPSAEQPAAFYRIWTRKEAYLKALGLGLSHPLQGFAVADADLADGRIRDVATGRLLAGWRLHPLAAPAGYAACLAFDQPPAAVMARPCSPAILDDLAAPPPAGSPST